LDAELDAFRVGHDDMLGPWFSDLLKNRGTEFPEPGACTQAPGSGKPSAVGDR